MQTKGEDETPFCGIYGDLEEVIGKDNVRKIYDNFRGQQITFPMHLYTSDYVARVASDSSNTLSTKELAVKYGYSERHVSRKKKQLVERANSN